MDKMKIVIIDDNEKFSAVLRFLFSIKNIYGVIASLIHADVSKSNMLQEASIAIVAVKSTDQKTLETVRIIKEKYALKVLALPLHLRDALVNELNGLKVDGILSKSNIDQHNIYEALNQISKNGKYYNLNG